MTFGTYRAFDLPAEDSYLADLIPWSATFTGHLERAEAPCSLRIVWET